MNSAKEGAYTIKYKSAPRVERSVNNFADREKGVTTLQLRQEVGVEGNGSTATLDLSSGSFAAAEVASQSRVALMRITGVEFDKDGEPIINNESINAMLTKAGAHIVKVTGLIPESVATEGQKLSWDREEGGAEAREAFINSKLSTDENGTPYLFQGHPIYTQFLVSIPGVESMSHQYRDTRKEDLASILAEESVSELQFEAV